MNPFLVTLILSIIAEAIKDYERLLKVKPFYYKGWVLIAALAVSAYYANKNNVDNDTKIAILDTTNSKLTKKVDSFRTSFDSGIKGVANEMSYNFGQTAKHGDTNTISILTDALSNKDELLHMIDSMRHKLDSLQNRDLPNLTYMGDFNQVKFTQNHDTFSLCPSIYNSGGTVAKNINWCLYYMQITDTSIREYYKPVMEQQDGEIPSGHHTSIISGDNYMTNFYFDSTLDRQFILVIGTYTDDNPKSPTSKNLCLVYRWYMNTKNWGISNAPNKYKAVHDQKKWISYFK